MKSQQHREDPLERFIFENRTSFEEDLRPSDHIWSTIQGELAPKAKVRLMQRGWFQAVAAVGLLLIGVALGAVLMKPAYTMDNTSFTEATDLEELEEYYVSELSTMQDMLVSNPDYKGIAGELTVIDGDIEELKKELGEVPRNARATVLQAIIASYETKVQLLENVMEYSKPFNERDEEGPTTM
ncbi:MAG: hypothetical protein KTR24_14990 [Saprospiraceae bacterium]|nr:hypothetical protein [Saprospiraceae bacterium]